MIQVIKCTSKPCINGYPASKLECPTCHKLALFPLKTRFSDLPLRLGIPGSFFCGQECFKANCEYDVAGALI